MKLGVLSILAAGGLFVGATVPASAALETECYNFGSASDPLAVGGGGSIANFSVGMFNTSLGTLDDIVITLTSYDSIQSQVVDVGGPASFQNAQASANITITGPDLTQTSGTLTTTPFSESIGADSSASLDGKVLSDSSGSSVTYAYGPAAQSKVSTSSSVPVGDFGNYEVNGGGTLDYLLNASTAGTSSGYGSPGVFFGYVADTYGCLDITYDYTPSVVTVPEPGTTVPGLVALAFCALIPLCSRQRTAACAS